MKLEYTGALIHNTPWAITPEMLQEIRRIYSDHRAGKVPDIQAIEAQLGRPLNNEQKPYQVVNGVAVISGSGVIAKRMDLFMKVSGGFSVEKISADFKTALADPLVRSIVLVLDSPGGSIDGIFEFADLVYASRDAKDILSLAYGTMASAAYLIGAAASGVYASDVAAVIGSIGVIAVHEDTSALDQRSGVVTTKIYRGKYKGLVADGPLTEEGRMTIEEKVDYYYSLFINTVARYRGVSAETVLTKMSTDVMDYFIGQQAVDAGLVDGIMSLDKAIDLAGNPAGIKNSGGMTASGKEKSMSDKVITTIEQLAAAYPELTAAVREQAVKDVDLEGPRAKAAEEERDRILGLAETHFGKEPADQFAAIVKSGATVDQYAAFKAANPAVSGAVTAEEKKKEEILAALKKTGAEDAGTETDLQAGSGKDFLGLVEEHMAANKCSKFIAMQAVRAKFPEKHWDYIKKANEGKGR
jgi:signal peptide peptidase SppA